jgi:hypothetical protein
MAIHYQYGHVGLLKELSCILQTYLEYARTNPL